MSRAPIASSARDRTSLDRRVPELFIDGFPLLLLGGALFSFDRWFTFMDDEALTLAGSARPVRVILADFFSGTGQHLYPPLYDLILHLWLLVTGGAPNWLRVPSMAFYIVALWLLSRAARRVGGVQSATALIWLGVLWPYGFQFSRLAGWYSFSFLLISALTLAYLRYCDSPGPKTWAAVCLLGLTLVYTSYFGWALLALLGVDDWLRNREKGGARTRLLGSAALLLVAYAPLWPAFVRAVSHGVNLHQPLKVLVPTLGYHVYVLLVSESVAPWHWRFGVPATLAVAASLLLVFFGVRGETRRFLLFGALLVAGMALTGILLTKRLFLVAPWFLLPTAIALGTIKNRYLRGALVISLMVASGIGWYGAYTRRYYSTPRFLEPWGLVAAEAAVALHNGAAVIGNNESFFFYLTYAVRAPQSSQPWHFEGILPEDVRAPQVWNASEWEEAGRPLPIHVLWVRGPSGPEQTKLLAGAGDWLDHHCGNRTDRYMFPDSGYDWEQRFFPQPGQDIWSMEIREYVCGANGAAAPAGNASPNDPQ